MFIEFVFMEWVNYGARFCEIEEIKALWVYCDGKQLILIYMYISVGEEGGCKGVTIWIDFWWVCNVIEYYFGFVCLCMS